MQRILETRLPGKPSAAVLAASQSAAASGGSGGKNADCGICYAHLLADEAPSKFCDNVKCAQPFHSNCLVEWLRSTPNTRQSFNTLFGTCPYCGEVLYCPTCPTAVLIVKLTKRC